MLSLKRLYEVNFIFVSFTCLASLTLFGLLLTIPLGIFQVSLLLYFVFNSQIDLSEVKSHIWTYSVVSVVILLLTIFLFTAGDLLMGPVIGLLVAWYHVWITKQVVLMNSKDSLEIN